MKSHAQVSIEAHTKINRQAIQEFINELHGVREDACIMTRIDCGTAACIGGWYRRFYMDTTLNGLSYIARHMGRHFGMDSMVLKHMMGGGDANGCLMFAAFDGQPGDLRKAAMIRCLETIIEHGQPSWLIAITDTFEPEVARKVYCETVQTNIDPASPPFNPPTRDPEW